MFLMSFMTKSSLHVCNSIQGTKYKFIHSFCKWTMHEGINYTCIYIYIRLTVHYSHTFHINAVQNYKTRLSNISLCITQAASGQDIGRLSSSLSSSSSWARHPNLAHLPILIIAWSPLRKWRGRRVVMVTINELYGLSSPRFTPGAKVWEWFFPTANLRTQYP